MLQTQQQEKPNNSIRKMAKDISQDSQVANNQLGRCTKLSVTRKT